MVETITMPIRDYGDFRPDDPWYVVPPYNPGDIPPGEIPPGGGGTGTGGGGTGGTTAPPSNWPWPAWAYAINPNVHSWSTLDDGYLRNGNSIYKPNGTFHSTLQEWLDELNPPADPVSIDGEQSDLYPFLVRRGGFWYDPRNNQYYSDEYQKIDDPTVIPHPGRPPNTTIGLGPDPGDGPSPVGIDVTWNPPSGGGGGSGGGGSGGGTPPTDYIGIPPPSQPGGPSQSNPMPGRPTQGVWSTAPHLNISRSAEGQPTGQQEQFKPWGQPMGEVSQALRYGGPPTQTQTGGFGARAAGSQEWNQPGIIWDNGVLRWGDKTWDAAFGGWNSPTTTAAATSAALRGTQ